MHGLTGPARALFDHLAAGDAEGVYALVGDLVDRGADLDDLADLVGAAQREVGRRWQRGEWTIAREHAATALAERALAMVAFEITEPAVRPTVLVACAEGEWHTLGPRVVADGLRRRRWDARFLGGSMPAEHLREHIDLERPLAVALSCAVPAALPGLQRSTAAVHEHGIPVLVGGRALTAARAAGIGADAWARDTRTAHEVLDRWWHAPTGRLGAPDAEAVGAHESLAADRAAIVARTDALLVELLPWLADATPAQRLRTREDIGHLLAATEAAVLADDRTILDEYLPWLVEVLEGHGVPAAVVHPTLRALATSLQEIGQDEVAALLQAAARETLPAGS
jgi:methanogenic corrinoid protein MtbC1